MKRVAVIAALVACAHPHAPTMQAAYDRATALLYQQDYAGATRVFEAQVDEAALRARIAAGNEYPMKPIILQRLRDDVR